jgi:hypothetical protein
LLDFTLPSGDAESFRWTDPYTDDLTPPAAGSWTRTTQGSQLHHLLLELIPGGAKKHLYAAQATALLAKVRHVMWLARPVVWSRPG